MSELKLCYSGSNWNMDDIEGYFRRLAFINDLELQVLKTQSFFLGRELCFKFSGSNWQINELKKTIHEFDKLNNL